MCYKFKPLATNLHGHAENSLDGASTSYAKMKHAKKIGMIAECLTDHGVMSGLYDHWLAGKKSGIIPIQGIEAYIVDPHRQGKTQKNGVVIPEYYHLTIHFKTTEAYFYFCRLSKKMEERAIVKYGERKPLMLLEELEPISGQITIGSGCLLSPVNKNALAGRYDLAEDMYKYLRRVSGPGNFFVEIFPHIIDHDWVRPEIDKVSKHIITQGYFKPITEIRGWQGRPEDLPTPDPCTGGIDIQKKPNEFVMSLAQKYKDPMVISLDDHFGDPGDVAVQRSRLGQGEERWRFYNSYHAMTSNEAAENLIKQLGVSTKQVEEWIDNSYMFVENFKEYKFPDRSVQTLLPTTSMVYGDIYTVGKSNKDIFWEKVKKHSKMPPEDSEQYKLYRDRVDYELKIITDNDAGIDFLPYCFLLEDICNYARSKKIVFTSRGSAAGSLALHLMGIIVVDPIKYGLSFERFLNPGRIKEGSWPDVDLDWEDRDVILKYVFDKYGECATRISSNGKMKLKSSIKDAERSVKGFVSFETEELTKALKVPLNEKDEGKWLLEGIHTPEGEILEKAFIDTPDPIAVKLKEYSVANPEIWEMVIRCLGITRQKGIHAGGIIITPGPVQNFMPVIKTRDGDDYATAYDMHGVEYVGGVKYDVLGITTLKGLGEAVRSIERETGEVVDIGNLPENTEVYEGIIKSMKLEGLFQVNTDVVKPYISAIKPRNIKDISNLIALCRPGALDAPSPDPNYVGTAAEYYVMCATNRKAPYYIHEDLKPILSDTHGIIIFQEQSIKIGVEFAGYSEGEADIIVRKGIGKKDQKKIAQFKNDLSKNLTKRGWTENQIDKLVESVGASASYSFNKAHSASYAVITWACAYIKHYYPQHYWKGMLTAFTDKEDTIQDFVLECQDMILPPDMISSDKSDWKLEGDNKLRSPLVIIKGCGDKGLESLCKFIKDIKVGEI